MCLLFSGEGIPALASVFAVQEKFEDKLSGGRGKNKSTMGIEEEKTE
jgi:hypothetical protein